MWVEIHNPPGFFSAMFQATADLGKFHVGPVWYHPRTFHPDDPSREFDAAFLKDPRFASEREWRAVWVPNVSSIRPVIRVIPELTRYCRLYRAAAHSKGAPPRVPVRLSPARFL
jgi:hypothetical protein